MHSIGVFFSAHCFGLLKYSRKSKRLTALVACLLLVQKDSWALSILISVNRILGRIKSSRFIRTWFSRWPYKHSVFLARENLPGTYPLAVKPMFWFSIWTNQIAGNYISSSGCGPDCQFVPAVCSVHFLYFPERRQNQPSNLPSQFLTWSEVRFHVFTVNPLKKNR